MTIDSIALATYSDRDNPLFLPLHRLYFGLNQQKTVMRGNPQLCKMIDVCIKLVSLSHILGMFCLSQGMEPKRMTIEALLLLGGVCGPSSRKAVAGCIAPTLRLNDILRYFPFCSSLLPSGWIAVALKHGRARFFLIFFGRYIESISA